MPRLLLRTPALARDERGSVILMSIVLVFVMTLLGLALFDLAAIENRMSLTSAADARAFEVAQAGVERGLRELRDRLNNDAYGSESWADAVNSPCTLAPCLTTTTGGYRAMPLPIGTSSMPGGGTFTLEVMAVTVSEANATVDLAAAPPNRYPIGATCLPDSTTPALCADLVFLRSTGTLDSIPVAGGSPAPPGFLARRAIQVLVRGAPSSVLANGFVAAGTQSGEQPIVGNALIAGSIHTMHPNGVGGPPVALDFSAATAGQHNNLAGLSAVPTLYDRIPALHFQQPVCLPGQQCRAPADRFLSLGATLKVAKPIGGTPFASSVRLIGSARIGALGTPPTYGPANQPGKLLVDGVFVADGCTAVPGSCVDSFSTPGNVQTDLGAIGRAYPDNPVPAFPLLTGPVTIGGNPYAGLTNYFIAKAHLVNPADSVGASIGSADGLQVGTPGFRYPIAFRHKVTNALRVGEICWGRGNLPLVGPPSSSRGGKLPPNVNTLEFGYGAAGPSSGCESPSTSQDPLLVYFPSPNPATMATMGFSIERPAGLANVIEYRGAAIFLTTGRVRIEEPLQVSCNPLSIPPCTGEKFPDDYSLTILTTEMAEIGRFQANVSPVMALVYASGDLVSRSEIVATPTRILGSFAASRFCLGAVAAGMSGTCVSGNTNLPQLFQVPGDPRLWPEEILALGISRNGLAPNRWQAQIVPRLWLECGPLLPATTLPATPSGICGY